MDTLPQSKNVTRSDFGASDFNVEDFLLNHHQYRTLGDLKQLVSKWEERLQKELQDTVNDNYQDLASSQDHLNQAKSSLESVKLEVLSYRAEISKMARQVGTQQLAAKAELDAQKKLSDVEFKAKNLLTFIETLEKSERLVPKTTLTDHQLVELVKAILELQVLTKEHANAMIVIENTQRLANLKEEIVRKVNERLLNGGGFQVLMARARLLE